MPVPDGITAPRRRAGRSGRSHAARAARHHDVEQHEPAVRHGWRDFWLQFLVFWTFNLAYEASRGLSDGARDAAFANGDRVIDAEQADTWPVTRFSRRPASASGFASRITFSTRMYVDSGGSRFRAIAASAADLIPA